MKTFVSTTVAMLIIGLTSVCLAQDDGASNSAPAKKEAARKKAKAPASATKPTDAADVAAPAKSVGPAVATQLRASIHRTMAALVEARAAEKPEEAKIKQLTEQLEGMQAKLRASQQRSPKEIAELNAKIHRTTAALVEAEAAEKPDGAKIKQLRQQLQTMQTELQCARVSDSSGQCPMPGAGRGPGQGYGQGRGMGMGMGQGQCYGPGLGQGQGLSQGRGPGQGRGRGGRR